VKIASCIIGVFSCLCFGYGCVSSKLEEQWTTDLSKASNIVHWTGTDKGMVATKIFTNDKAVIQDLASKFSEATESAQVLMGPVEVFLFLGPNGEPIAGMRIIEIDSSVEFFPLSRRGKFYFVAGKNILTDVKYKRAEKFVRAVYAYMQIHEPEKIAERKKWYKEIGFEKSGLTYEDFLFGRDGWDGDISTYHLHPKSNIQTPRP